jgi:FkbM family methyltransferase
MTAMNSMNARRWSDEHSDGAVSSPRSAFHSCKPRNPYPQWCRQILRRVMPHRMFRRYVGRHEDESQLWWSRLVARVTEGGAILDIGAFRGEYALAARRVNPDAAIYAFEPNPGAVRELNEACVPRRIEVIEAAVWSTNGQARFLPQDQGSRVVRESERASSRLHNDDGNAVSVLTITLDSWARDRAVRPALIKIDTEGAETAVFRGAQQVLMCCRPLILCEVLTDEAGATVEEALPDGYRYYWINENGGIRVKQRITRTKWRNKNWLLIPAEKEAATIGCVGAAHARPSHEGTLAMNSHEQTASSDTLRCPACGEARHLRGVKVTSIGERVRKRLTGKRLCRCFQCGWRGWLPRTQNQRQGHQKLSQWMAEPQPPSLSVLDAQLAVDTPRPDGAGPTVDAGDPAPGAPR